MAPDRAPKAVSPSMADQRQNDVPGGCGWSEMEEGVMRNKIQLVVSPIFGENPGGTKRNSRGFSSFDRRRSEKLALSQTSLRGLLEEMKALVNLRYLNLEETSKMSRIPKQLISSLSKLQVLRMLKCSGSVLSDDAEPLMKELLCLEHLDVISLTLDCSRANVIPILFKYRKLVSVTQSLEISSFWFGPRLNASDLANLASMEKLGDLNFMLCNFEEFKSTGDVEKVLQSRFRSLHKIVINGYEVKDLTWLVFVPNLQQLDISLV
ncbi:probable disease resistance protein At1g61300 [Citrus sinensis]|uniref:probable disease resistance protein At1g61300 n=1 Tax=Citrus sinensis TaxID=2711 RepID=UPI002277B5E4|nr:probable disease resistance protein At1g61300 [Citrus sinensis]